MDEVGEARAACGQGGKYRLPQLGLADADDIALVRADGVVLYIAPEKMGKLPQVAGMAAEGVKARELPGHFPGLGAGGQIPDDPVTFPGRPGIAHDDEPRHQ